MRRQRYCFLRQMTRKITRSKLRSKNSMSNDGNTNIKVNYYVKSNTIVCKRECPSTKEIIDQP